jgi:hypothetical protein
MCVMFDGEPRKQTLLLFYKNRILFYVMLLLFVNWVKINWKRKLSKLPKNKIIILLILGDFSQIRFLEVDAISLNEDSK